jgi:hypothetical protein
MGKSEAKEAMVKSTSSAKLSIGDGETKKSILYSLIPILRLVPSLSKEAQQTNKDIDKV